MKDSTSILMTAVIIMSILNLISIIIKLAR